VLGSGRKFQSNESHTGTVVVGVTVAETVVGDGVPVVKTVVGDGVPVVVVVPKINIIKRN